MTPNTIDLKLRQIETVRSVVDHVRRESDIPSDKTEELDRELANIIQRLRDLARPAQSYGEQDSVEIICRKHGLQVDLEKIQTVRRFRRADYSTAKYSGEPPT